MTSSASQYGVPPMLLASLLQQESGYNPRAIGRYANGRPSGAKGIAQFMPGTAGSESEFDPFNPQQAIPRAAKHLRGLYDGLRKRGIAQNEAWAVALAAYNTGLGNVDKAIARSGSHKLNVFLPYLAKETQGYVPSILKMIGG